MKIKQLTSHISVSDQIVIEDVQHLAEQGVDFIICNRPDNEANEQPSFNDIAQAATALGVKAAHIPFVAGKMTPEQVQDFRQLCDAATKVHAYCRTGNRSSIIYDASTNATPETTCRSKPTINQSNRANSHYEVVIIGAGSGGIATAASLKTRNPKLRVLLIDPATEHYYQPGWTMVGGGVFNAQSTVKPTRSVIPKGVDWKQNAVTLIRATENLVVLDNDANIHYDQLVIAPGLVLDWSAIEGLEETLGKNGVTSNYRYDLAPYTWQLVNELQGGTAIFSQPPMPIKCAGAPQKALYLSADHWLKSGIIEQFKIKFCNAGPGLFGVADYVPVLKSYMEKYGAQLNFNHNLVKVDGDKQTATFCETLASGEKVLHDMAFDMLHVCPVQKAPAFIHTSQLADSAGWLDVDKYSLQHTQYKNVWGLGDVTNTPNAKTMAAVRQQAPVLAQNIIDTLAGKAPSCGYFGYGSCPLTVERGRILLAEFSYGGEVTPTFPEWVNKGKQATKRAWLLKASLLPSIYWQGMLKGREWFAKPATLPKKSNH